jgi:hypothetical protein
MQDVSQFSCVFWGCPHLQRHEAGCKKSWPDFCPALTQKCGHDFLHPASAPEHWRSSAKNVLEAYTNSMLRIARRFVRYPQAGLVLLWSLPARHGSTLYSHNHVWRYCRVFSLNWTVYRLCTPTVERLVKMLQSVFCNVLVSLRM